MSLYRLSVDPAELSDAKKKGVLFPNSQIRRVPAILGSS